VQPRAQRLQEPFVAAQLARLALGDEAARVELAPAAAEACRARDPQDGLQVAQPAGAFLHVRFEAVRRVLELRVALTHLEHLRGEERARIERLFVIANGEALEQRGAAEDAARLEQRGLHGDVLRRLFDALRDRPHAAADLEAEIPAIR
jgi:hypothetical protein